MSRTKRKSVTVEYATEHFLDWIGHNKEPNTLKTYSRGLKPFRTLFGERSVRKIRQEKVEKYFQKVNHWDDGSPKAPDTIRGNITAIERLEFHINKRLRIPCELVYDIEKPVGRVRERIPTAEEALKIKSVASPAFNLAYDALRRSGARPNEIASATMENWLQEQFVIVLPKHKTARKTGRARKIVVGEKFEAIIRKSIGTRTEGPLFLTPQGHQWTTDTLSQSYGRYRNKVGIDKELKLYCERHGFATACHEEEFNETSISFLMGHSGSQTRDYIHPNLQKLRIKQDAVKIPGCD